MTEHPTIEATRTGPYRWRDVWPRKDRHLPPGQRTAAAMPRFSARPEVPPPAPGPVEVVVRGRVLAAMNLDLAQLARLPLTHLTADFHCVTTWTVPDLAWSGWRLVEVWNDLIVPQARPDPRASHLRVHGADGYWAVLDLRDALTDDVLLASRLEGRPLDAAHGAPLRLVSPAQYGYKSVKHVAAISVVVGEPRRHGRAIEHPRARVAAEERHRWIPGPLLRWPYRALIIPTAAIAQRSAARSRDVSTR